MKYITNTLIILLAMYSTFFWLGALATPFLSHFGGYDLSAKLSYILSNACHQNPERSFWLLGYPVSLCARCLGVYTGTTVSCLIALFNKLNISIKAFIIMVLFCSADIILNLFKINTGNIIRFCTGLIMGVLITFTVNFILKKWRKSMKIKKLIALTLIIVFAGLFPAQITSAVDEEQTLYEFINNNKEITAKFEYPSFIASTKSTGKKLLPAHTPIIIKNEQEINTKNIKKGETIVFVVAQDVTDANGNVFIKANTPVSANIDFQPRELIGKSAKLTITDFHTKAVDGSYIPLSSVITEEPDDKMVLSIVLSATICLLFLLMKGRQAKIPADTIKTVYTNNDVYIKLLVI